MADDKTKDEKRLAGLAKRLLATPPKPRKPKGSPEPKKGKGKKMQKPQADR